MKLKVWKESHEIALEIYRISKAYPKDEVYGITSQLRRSALSISTNIAEGCGRSSEQELRRFCYISMGSASELEYLLLFSMELGLLSNDEYEKILDRLLILKKRLNAFIQKLKTKQPNSQT